MTTHPTPAATTASPLAPPITTSYRGLPGGPSLQVGGIDADLSETRRLVTVLFADLSGSTRLGERLDPEELRRILASFFAALAQQIHRYEGTVDKYIGDAVMAVFGAPVAHEDDAVRAISAALGMQAAIGRLNDELERAHGVRLRLRIGINTGEVVAGLLAGDVQSAYTVVGDTVNTAQRIESAAPHGEVLVDETTCRLARQAFELEPVAPLTLKGKSEPVPAYRVVRRREAEAEPDAALVGREAEMGTLLRALEDAVGGAGRLMLVVGEAGVGKTRLVRELRARAADVRQLTARVASYEAQTPYALIAHVLRGTFGVRPGDDEATSRATVERGLETAGGVLDPAHVTLLLDVLGFGERSTLDPETKRRLLVAVLRRLLSRQCERGPLLVVLEDLHWMDAASAAVLGELAREIPRQRCMLLATTRPQWTPPPWTAERLELAPLGVEDARALVEEAFGRPVEDTLAETIIARTGGNPFFVREVARSLAEAEVLEERGGRLAARAGQTPRVPETVQELLEARLDRLPLGPKRVLQPAAVVGRTFWYRLLEQLAPQAHLATELAVLERESLIAPQPAAPEPTYAFRHALIQEVAYQQLLQSQRRAMHRAVGGVLERLYAERLEEYVDLLAYHYGRSDDDEKALHWLVRAADRAKALYANESALALYGAALERARDGEGPLDAGTILEKVGDVQTLVGRYDEALESFRAAAERIKTPGAPTLARLWRKRGVALRIRGGFAEALAMFGEALAVLGDREDEEAARIRVQLGQAHWRRGEYEAARVVLTEAVDIGGRLGVEDAVAEGLKQLGNVALHGGKAAEAEVYFRRSGEVFERLDDLGGIADVHVNLGGTYFRMGRWDDALREFGESLALRERMGNPWGIGMCHNNMGEVHRVCGDAAKAFEAFERAIAIWEPIGYASGVAIALIGRGAALVDLGETERARADLREAEERLASIGSTMYLADLYRCVALADLAAGDLAKAEVEAGRSLEAARAASARHQEAMTERVLGQIAHARGEGARARALLEASRAALAELGELGELRLTEEALTRLAATAA